MFKELKKRAKAMEKTLSSLNETLIAANKTASVSTRLVLDGEFNLLMSHYSTLDTLKERVTSLWLMPLSPLTSVARL